MKDPVQDFIDATVSAVVQSASIAAQSVSTAGNKLFEFVSEHKTELVVVALVIAMVTIGLNYQQLIGMLENAYSTFLYLKKKLRGE